MTAMASTNRNARAMAVRARTETPISIKAPIPLEGVLFDARFRRDPETYGTPLSCLAQDDGIYRASSSFVVVDGIAGVGYGTAPVVKRIDTRGHALRHVDLGPESPRSETSITAMSPMRPSLAGEQILTGVSELVWMAYGDLDEVHRMLRHVPGLGKLRGRGYGLVSAWEVQEIEPSDDADLGWFCEGRVIRRLPSELVLRRLGRVPPGTESSMGRLEPPYWEGHKEAMMVHPTLRSMTVTSPRLRDILAA